MNNNNRNLSFDLLRCIAMIMIVVWHYYIHGIEYSIFPKEPISLFNYVISQYIIILCSVCVNTYILISGFFLITKDFKTNRFINIWFQAMVYNVIIIFLLNCFRNHNLAVKDILNAFFPIRNKAYWFINCYLGLIIISPFLAKAASSLSKRSYDYLMIMILILGTKCLWNYPLGDVLDFNNGYSFVWFICLFLTGGYIRRFDLRWKYLSLKTFFLLAGLICIIKCALTLHHHTITLTYPSYNSYPFILSFILLYSFKRLYFQRSKTALFIQFIVPMTFGVYLIHDHKLIRSLIWGSTSLWINDTNSYTFLPKMICISIIIYILCTIIEYIRIKTFHILGIDIIIKNLCKKLDSIIIIKI